MEYKGHEICARVHFTGSKLYDLDNDGNLAKEVDGCKIEHKDEKVVWYEVECVDPKSGLTSTHTEIPSLKDAKELIDNSIRYLEKNNRI